MFSSPGEIAFRIFNFPVHWYGIFMAFAICTGLFTILAIKKKYYPDIEQDVVLDLAFYNIIFGILGARLYYVVLDYKYYLNYPQEILALWHGGLSIHGAIIICIIVSFIFLKSKKLQFLPFADLFIYGLVVGQVIGRWGNFFNSEAFGRTCNLPWKLFIPISSRPIEFYNQAYYHPTFLYESLLSILIFCLLFFGIRKIKNAKAGIIFYSYLILYGLSRFLIEGIRIDSVLDIHGVPVAKIMSLVLIFAGIFGLIFLYCRKNIKTLS